MAWLGLLWPIECIGSAGMQVPSLVLSSLLGPCLCYEDKAGLAFCNRRGKMGDSRVIPMEAILDQ